MASQTFYDDKVNRINEVKAFHDLGSLIGDFPEMLLSQKSQNAIIKAMPRIVRENINKEKAFDLRLISNIIEVSRIYETGGYNKNFDPIHKFGKIGSYYWPIHILRTYAETMFVTYGKECLEPINYNNDTVKRFCEEKGIDDIYEYLGWIFLAIKPSDIFKNNSITQQIWLNMSQSFPDFKDGFLKVFADAIVPMGNRDNGIKILSDIWSHTSFINKLKDEPSSNIFFSALKNTDLGWLDEQINLIEDKSLIIKEDVFDLFTNLANVVNDDSCAEAFFFEYIALISSYYPMEKQRQDIATRYEKFFSDRAIIYLIDLYAALIENLSGAGNKNLTRNGLMFHINNAAKACEKVIIDIKIHNPNIDVTIIYRFFDDAFKSFGYEIKKGTGMLSSYVYPIINEVFKKSDTAIESDCSYLTIMNDVNNATKVLEGSYDDGDSTSESIKNSDLHKKAKTGNAGNMKSNEKRIYKAYHKYKDNEKNVDDKLATAIGALKRAVSSDQGAMIIEGKKFSPIGFLKKLLTTIAIFDVSKISAVLFLIVSHSMKRKTKKSEKRKILSELENELVMVNEKIEDARGDGNRQAKYDLMRSRNALQNAIKRIKYGLSAEEVSESGPLNSNASNDYRG